VHLRRGLLLFAIVMITAALAAALSQPRTPVTRRGEPPPPPAQAAPRPPLEVRFSSRGRPVRRRVPLDRAVTVRVSAGRSGSVEIRGLGLFAPVAPGTPARFDVLFDEPAAHRIVFTPTGGRPSTVGTLVARRRGPPT